MSPALELRPRAVDRVDDVGEKMSTGQVDQRRDVLRLESPQASDPFLFLSEDWFSRVGFDWHPHRGFETVTYVVEGELEHEDNAGGAGVLRPGDLQWVTTGRGVIHSELAHRRRPVHTLQLWLNLPARLKLSPPRYQDLRAQDAPVVREPGVEARVFAGTVAGVRGPAETLWPTSVVDARMEKGARFTHELPGEHAAFFYVLEGAVRVGKDARPVRGGQVAWLDASEAGPTGVELVAEADTHWIAYSAAPIREPIVQYGPFVMNRKEEILQAIQDYQAGKFGPIPGE